MDTRWKKIALIIGFVALTGLIGYGIYRVFFYQPAKPGTPPTPTSTINGLPNAGDATGIIPTQPINTGALPSSGVRPGGSLGGAISGSGAPSRTTILRSEATTQISVNGNAGAAVRSYSPNDGLFYKTFADGTTIPLSKKVFFSVESVTWGNISDRAILTFPDGSNILYDFTFDQQTTLPAFWEDFSFGPNDGGIAAKSVGNDPSNRFLIMADDKGNNAKVIEDLGENQDKVHVSWSPNNQVVAYAFTGDAIGQDAQAVVLVGQNHENFRNLLVEGRGFTPRWSPSGDGMVYSVWSSSNGYLPELWFSRADGENVNAGRSNLSVTTWADKCAWTDEQTVYCAVPVQLGDGAGLQRELFDRGPDAIYKINVRTGEKTNLGVPDGNINVKEISASSDGTLFLVDRQRGNLVKFDTN